MTDFQIGGVSKKNIENEVKPRPPEPKKMVAYCDEVDTTNGLKYISQDIDLDDPLPIEEILIPSLKFRASSSLMATKDNSDKQLSADTCQAGADHQSASRAGDTLAKKRKPRLTITLEVHRTIIDRRPMLRKMKSKPQTVANQIEGPGEQVSSTSLIGPGEDCDDSDDNDIMEIDCGDPELDCVRAQ